MISEAGGAGPHGSTAARISGGASSSSSEPPVAISAERAALSAAAAARASATSPEAKPKPSEAYQANEPLESAAKSGVTSASTSARRDGSEAMRTRSAPPV